MGVTRNFIFAIDPYKEQSGLGAGVCSSISFTAVPDGNDTEKAFTCGYAPPTRGSGVSISQETLFLGTNTEAGKMYQTLSENLSQDGTASIAWEFITARIDPDSRPDSGSRESSTKRYEGLDFNGPSLLEHTAQAFWTKDCNPIEDSSVTWKEFSYDSGDTGLYFESGLANWVHLKGTGSGTASRETMLSGFTVRYRHVGKGAEGRES